MADIELDSLDNRPEEEPEEQQEEETNIDNDWRDESIIIIDTSNPDAGIPNPRKDAGVIKRAYTEDKKSLLREMNININKGEGPSIFKRLKVTVNRKGKVNGGEFDGVRIIVQKGKRLEYTEDVRKASKVNEFKELVKTAEEKHAKTAVGFVEEVTPDVNVSEERYKKQHREPRKFSRRESQGGRVTC